MNEIEQVEDKIFKNCIKEYNKRGINVDENWLRNVIKISNTHGDGKKRIVFGEDTYLIPIEDIILFGIRGADVPKYPKEEA